MTCSLDYSRLASILKPSDDSTVYVTDMNFNILYTDVSDTCNFINYIDRVNHNLKVDLRKQLEKGASKVFSKLWNSTPVHVSSLPQNDTLVILERPYTHPLSRKGFLTPNK